MILNDSIVTLIVMKEDIYNDSVLLVLVHRPLLWMFSSAKENSIPFTKRLRVFRIVRIFLASAVRYSSSENLDGRSVISSSSLVFLCSFDVLFLSEMDEKMKKWAIRVIEDDANYCFGQEENIGKSSSRLICFFFYVGFFM